MLRMLHLMAAMCHNTSIDRESSGLSAPQEQLRQSGWITSLNMDAGHPYLRITYSTVKNATPDQDICLVSGLWPCLVNCLILSPSLGNPTVPGTGTVRIW